MELLKARGGPGLLPPEEKPDGQFAGRQRTGRKYEEREGKRGTSLLQ